MQGVTLRIRLFSLSLILTFGLLTTTSSAEVLDWPIGNYDTSGTWVPGHGAYVQQNFGHRWHPFHPGQAHAGIDLQLRDPATGDVSSAYTVNKEVRAAAGGFVVFRNPSANWPGGVLVLEHENRLGRPFYTLYAHIGQMIGTGVGGWVGRGEVLGRVVWQADDNTHLHFEVRGEDADSFPGGGYGAGGSTAESLLADGFFDPTEHYFTHRRACTGEGLHESAASEGLRIRSSPQILDNNLVEVLPRHTAVQVEDVFADAGGSGNWWFEVSYRSGNQVRHGFAGALAEVGQAAVLNLVQKPRACELIVPGFNNGTHRRWDTNLYLQNIGPVPLNIRVTVYKPDTASNSFSDTYLVYSNQGKKISIPDEFRNGTAVIRSNNVSEQTEDIAVIARHHYSNPGWVDGDTFSSWEAVRRGASRQVVPVVHRANHGWDNVISIYNPSTGIRKIDLDFSGSNQCDQNDIIVYGRRTLVIDTETWKNECLYSGYVGSLEILATDYSGNPRPVMVASRQENRLGGGAYESMATVGLTASGHRLFLPLIQNQNYDYRAGIGAGRISGSGSLMADYREALDGSLCHDETLSGWPIIETPFPTTGHDECPQVISGHLELSAHGQMFAQFNQLYENPDTSDPNYNHDSSSCPAEAHPSTRAYLPYFDEEAHLHGIQIQNTEGQTATATVRFFRSSGSLIRSRTVTIAPYGSATLVHQIPSATRSARVESDTKISVLVNNVMNTGEQDDLMDYVAPTGVD